jgi:TonB-dependent starch-binding outer membrane protein SusC
MRLPRFLEGALVAHVLAAALLVAPALTGQAQQATGRIEGTVTDARSHQPLNAASVFVQGTGMGSQTNDRGRFALVNVPPGRYEIRVRRIGYQNLVRPVTLQEGQVATVNVEMNEAAVSLDEVVVTGTAATTRAREVPTSTDIVNAKAFENAPVANAQQIIAGRIPSVTVQANSGQPGAGGSIKIRGTNTITQSTDPLLYVDGVRVYNELTRNNWGARTAANPLQDINPDDIERIEIVKGAAATTLYGTEASGGVIQVFTKKGLAGAPEWATNLTTGANVNSQWGAKGDPTHLFTECGNTSQLYGIITSGTKVGQRQYFRDPSCPSDGNWTDPGPLQQYDLSVRGGSQKVSYFVSGNYGDVRGILPTQRSKDGGFRGNFGFFPIDQLQLLVNTAYTRRNTRWAGDGNNSEGFLLNVGRGWRGYMQGGKGDQCAAVTGDTVCITNGAVFDQTLTTRSDHYLSGVSLNYAPNAHLSNRLAVGWDYTVFNNVTNLPFGFQSFRQGYFWDENSNHTKLSFDYAGSLQNQLLSSSLASTFSWGGQLFRDRHRWTEIDVQSFAGPGDPTLTTGAELTYRNDLPTAVTNAGFFLQEQIGFRDRLFLTAGLRVDGNSAFGEDFGLQKYPKLGVSYVLSDHDFWPKQWIETFKVRGAVGESGKAPGAFDKLRTWSPITGDENKPGFTPSNVGNRELGPERTRELEGGFDASFFGGLLGSELTYYNARTFDALVPVTRPPSGGFSNAQLQNVGEIRNSGVELQLNAAILRSSSFDWRVRANTSRMWSKAVDLGANTEVYTGLGSYIKCTPNPDAGPGDSACDTSKGEAFPRYYGLKVANPNEVGTPIIEENKNLGNVNPDRLWGVGTTLTLFNNLSLDAFLEHQGGFVVQNYTAYQNARRGVWQPCYDTQEKMVASWGPDKKAGTADDNAAAWGDTRALDRVRCAFTGHDIGYWTEAGDFTKLRYVSLTYNLPSRFIRASRTSVTLSGRNLVTWTKYHGADPEVQDVGDQANNVGTSGRFGRRDYYQIPQGRTFTISLRATF